MVALRSRATSLASSGPFWFSALCAALIPTSMGYQDLAALLARRPGVAERWRDHLIASPFGTIDIATFSFSRPIGTTMPEPLVAQPVDFDPSSLDVKIWSANDAPLERAQIEVAYPVVNRRLKGDRLPLPPASPAASAPERAPQLQPIDAPAPPPTPAPSPAAAPRLKNAAQPDAVPPLAPATGADGATAPATSTSAPASSHAVTMAAPPVSAAAVESGSARDAEVEDDAAIADRPPEIPAPAAADNETSEPPPSPFAVLSFLEEDPVERNAEIYFGVGALGSRDGLQQWAPGAEPVLVSPTADSGIELAALESGVDSGSGEEVVRKDDASRLLSPAERLGLNGRPRARAEKCLADAVYFEARGEPLRGQEAVAQVVMNRVFSGYYPHDVCGVVYQNANHYLACQFTFACDGIPDVVHEPDMWAQAKRIAKDTLDGKIWLAEVGHATHYHAYWVHPSWVHEMRKMYKLGVHTFYRPRAWGDGSDAPIWGTAPATPRPEAAKDPASVTEAADVMAKIPEAEAAPAAMATVKVAPTTKL